MRNGSSSQGRWISGARRLGDRPIERLERRDLMALVVGPVIATEDLLFQGTVARFNAADVAGPAADATAAISWGDGGSPTAGRVVADPGGGFAVVGSKTFAQFGLFPVVVTLTGAGGATTAAQGEARVADAPLTPTGTRFTATAGRSFSGTVATFQDSDDSPQSDFSATIDWGAGEATTTGTVVPVTLDGRRFYSVTGTYTYRDTGTREATITIVRIATGQTVSTTSIGTVVSSPLAASGTLVAATANAPFNGPVATFTDPGTVAPSTDYTATINWGPGLPTTVGRVVPVTGATDRFTVEGTFTYLSPGISPIAVTIARPSIGQTASAASTAIVAPSLTAVGTALSAVQNQQFTAVVATFFDLGQPGGPGAYTATINWGGSTPSTTTGSIVLSANDPTRFDVVGTFAYSASGPFTVTVTINRAETGQTATAQTSAVVSGPLIGAGLPIDATAGLEFSGPVATFSGPLTGDASNTGAYAATIDWGDGRSSPATIFKQEVAPTGQSGGTSGQSGGMSSQATTSTFLVFGSHTYAAAGTFTVRVTVVRQDTGRAFVFEAVARARAFTGALAPGDDSGGPGADGITKVDQPTFVGTVEPRAIVRLFARKADQTTPFAIGTTIAGSDGRWTLTSPPLVDGTYAITGVVVPTAGSPTAPEPLATIQVDTVAPRVLGVEYNPRTRQVTATFRDDRSGLDLARLSDRTIYALLGPRGARAAASSARVLPTVAAVPSDPRTAVVTFTLPPRFRNGHRALRIVAGGLTDRAGNALAGQRFPIRIVSRTPHPRGVARD